MKVYVLCVMFVYLASFKTVQQYPGTNLRGKIILNTMYGQQNAVGFRVDLFVYNGVSWQLLGTSFTDNYGFYYFRLVPPGNYVIRINQTSNYNINVVYINYSLYSFQDLPILYL